MQQNIFSIKCSQCGSPLRFDILTQNYHCASCGCDMPAAEVTEKARKLNEAFDAEQKIRLTRSGSAHSLYKCRSCGASVMLAGNELMKTCSFCGTSVTKSHFSDAQFPQAVIPFYITRDEAVNIFAAWAERNWNVPQKAVKIKKVRDNLEGYYMPFKMVSGPLRLDFLAYDRKYTCGGYLDGIFISQSGNAPNLVLDAAEPFNTSDLVPFDFSYMAGHKALMPDIETEELNRRIAEEVSQQYQPYISKMFHVGDRPMVMSSSGDTREEGQMLITNTVYLPMYIFNIDKYTWCVVNGQTGRVACGRNKNFQKSTHGFLKRRNDGALARVLHEFPQYRPQHPLFYKMVTGLDGKPREKAGLYSANIMKRASKFAKPCFVIGALYYTIVFFKDFFGSGLAHPTEVLMSELHGIIIAVSLFALIILLSIHGWIKEPEFEEVVPKYRYGGANGDSETYYSEKKRKREIITYSIVVVVFLTVVALLVCWIMGAFS